MDDIIFYIDKCKELLDEAELIGNTFGEQINEVKNGYLDDIKRVAKLILNKLDEKEHQLKLVNQDNDALSRYCDYLEKKITQLANMQDKKVILE